MKHWGWVWGVGSLFLAATPAQAALNLNTASASQMEKELGLTRQQAVNIIARRERQPFQSASELSSVDGFDTASASRLSGQVTAQPSTKVAKTTTHKAAGTHKARKSKKAHSKSTKAKKTTGATSLLVRPAAKRLKPPRVTL